MNPIADAQGYIARDDDKKELIVALRGRYDQTAKKDGSFLKAYSASVVDFLMDSQVVLVPFMVPGILNAPPDSKHAESSARTFTKSDSLILS